MGAHVVCLGQGDEQREGKLRGVQSVCAERKYGKCVRGSNRE